MSLLLKAVREKCIDCSGGSLAEVRLCAVVRCALWPYRMGENPYARRRGLLPPRPNGLSKKSPLIVRNSGGKRPSSGGGVR